MKTVCYTALAGDYDTLRDPIYVSEDWDYICFTDQPLKQHAVWEIRPLQKVIEKDAVRTNRWHKTHPHLLFPEYEASIYIDANIQITGSHLESRFKQLIKDDTLIALPPHPARRCVYDEITECLRTQVDCARRIRDMKQLLINDAFPRNCGFFENNIVFRRHNRPEIVVLDMAWWDLIVQYSRRDQLSLTYVLWKQSVDAELLVPDGETIRNHPDYHYMLHTHLLPKKKTSRRRLAKLVTSFIPVKHWRHTARNVLNGNHPNT